MPCALVGQALACPEEARLISPREPHRPARLERDDVVAVKVRAHLFDGLDVHDARAMDAREALTLIDVREPWEYDIAQITGSKLIPLGELEERLTELPREGMLIIQCHSGGRSEHGARLLQEAGFTNVYNLEGGIEAWSRDVDPTVPRY